MVITICGRVNAHVQQTRQQAAAYAHALNPKQEQGNDQETVATAPNMANLRLLWLPGGNWLQTGLKFETGQAM